MQQLIDEENKAPEAEADGKVVAAFRFRGRGQGRELFVKGVTLSEVWGEFLIKAGKWYMDLSFWVIVADG
jgi:hypothetical protein